MGVRAETPRDVMTVAQIEIPAAEITGLCQRNGIRVLALFGSVLTSRFSSASDVDLRTPIDLSRYFRDEVVRDALVLYAVP
jgi:predicted nucleotidyltransferase